MSVSLLASVDLMAAAARAERVSETLSLSALPRFVEAAPASAAGELSCDLVLTLGDDDLPRIRGRLSGHWVLECQRCLGPLPAAYDIDVDWRFAPDDDEGFTLGEAPVRLLDFVEDELLLALPAVPVHAREDDCGPLVQGYLARPGEDGAGETRTPFAGLKDLMRDADG